MNDAMWTTAHSYGTSVAWITLNADFTKPKALPYCVERKIQCAEDNGQRNSLCEQPCSY